MGVLAYLTSATLGLLGITHSSAVTMPPVISEFQDCEVCPVMVVIPAGSFLSRTASLQPKQTYTDQFTFYAGEIQHETKELIEDEITHRIHILKPYAVSKLEVTASQFSAFMNDSDYVGGRFSNYNSLGNLPAGNITWHDAVAYVEWLSKKTGGKYRLLTEAEWEYASRAGSNTVYPFSTEDLSNFANNLGDTDGYARLAPGGSFLPNKFGLYDMIGNLWEWTLNCWNDHLIVNAEYDAKQLEVDCEERVLRGGSWAGTTLYKGDDKFFYRWQLSPKKQIDFVGLRIAKSL